MQSALLKVEEVKCMAPCNSRIALILNSFQYLLKIWTHIFEGNSTGKKKVKHCKYQDNCLYVSHSLHVYFETQRNQFLSLCSFMAICWAIPFSEKEMLKGNYVTSNWQSCVKDTLLSQETQKQEHRTSQLTFSRGCLSVYQTDGCAWRIRDHLNSNFFLSVFNMTCFQLMWGLNTVQDLSLTASFCEILISKTWREKMIENTKLIFYFK